MKDQELKVYMIRFSMKQEVEKYEATHEYDEPMRDARLNNHYVSCPELDLEVKLTGASSRGELVWGKDLDGTLCIGDCLEGKDELVKNAGLGQILLQMARTIPGGVFVVQVDYYGSIMSPEKIQKEKAWHEKEEKETRKKKIARQIARLQEELGGLE